MPRRSRSSFDPAVLSYRRLLEFFFQIHDPTTPNRQGNDRGMSYRSAIYFASEAQRLEAIDTIQDVEASGLWPGKVVTEVAPVGAFWQAEPEHQDYLRAAPWAATPATLRGRTGSCHGAPRPERVRRAVLCGRARALAAVGRGL